jgi:hypothetical protein
MGTPQDRKDIRARCISPCEGAWRASEFLSDPLQMKRVSRELSIMKITKAHLIQAKRGEVRIVAAKDESDKVWYSQKTSDAVTLRYQDEPVNGMWLPVNESIVTELTGKPFLMVRGGGMWLAMHFSEGCVGLISDTFLDRGIVARNISVHAFFGNPRGAARDYYGRLEADCKRLGMKAECQLRLPAEGKFGYFEHPQLNRPNLGIFTLLC